MYQIWKSCSKCEDIMRLHPIAKKAIDYSNYWSDEIPFDKFVSPLKHWRQANQTEHAVHLQTWLLATVQGRDTQPDIHPTRTSSNNQLLFQIACSFFLSFFIHSFILSIFHLFILLQSLHINTNISKNKLTQRSDFFKSKKCRFLNNKQPLQPSILLFA